MSNKLYSFGRGLVKWVALIFVAYLSIGSALTYIYDSNWMEVYVVSKMIYLNIFGLMMFTMLFGLLVYLRNKFPLTAKKWNKIYAVILFVIFLLTFISLPIPQSDQANVLKGVVETAKGDYSYLNEPYFKTWGHMLTMVAVMKLFGATPFVFYLLNFILMLMTFNFLMNMTKDNKFLASALVLCLPLIQYTCFYYGEFMALFAITGSLYYIGKIMGDNPKKVDFVNLFIINFLGLLFKNNFIIFIIAEVLSIVLFILKTKNKRYFTVMLVVILSTISVNPIAKAYTKAMLGVTPNKTNTLSYLAMGMHDMGEPLYTTQIEGGYDAFNAMVVHNNNYDHELANKESIEDIKKSLKHFSEDPAHIFEFYNGKLLKQWTTPDWCANHAIRMTRYSNLSQVMIDQESENFDTLTYDYEQFITPLDNISDIFSKGMLLVVYFGATFLLINRKSKDFNFNEVALLALFIGNFLFSIIWEAKGRYCIYGYYALILFVFSQFDTIIAFIKYKVSKYFDFNFE